MLGIEPDIYKATINSNPFKTFAGNAEVTVGSHVTPDAKLSVSEPTGSGAIVGGPAGETPGPFLTVFSKFT